MLPAFFWHLLSTPYLRAQIESFARTAVGNYAIGGKDIWKLQFPLPSLDVQKTLVTAISHARTDTLALRQQATVLREQAKRQIEAALLGQTNQLQGNASKKSLLLLSDSEVEPKPKAQASRKATGTKQGRKAVFGSGV